MELAWVAAFATALCFGVGAIYEDRAAKQPVPASARSSVLHVVTRGRYLAGMALSLVGWVLSLLALQRLPLFAVQAIGASSIGVVVVLHRFLTHQAVPRRQAALLGVLGLGLAALAAAAEPGEPRAVPTSFDVVIWVAVALIAVLGVVAVRVNSDRAAALLGSISGLAYGGTSLCARALETDRTLRGLILNSLTIALLPFAALGIGLFATALQRGAVGVAAATQHATMTVVPAAVGLVVLGDHARSGFVPVAWTGFVLTVGAVLALTMVQTKPPSAIEAG